jgi:hypothetical protein
MTVGLAFGRKVSCGWVTPIIIIKLKELEREKKKEPYSLQSSHLSAQTSPTFAKVEK